MTIPLLNPLVSRARFAGAVREIRSEAPAYEGVWRLRRAVYPSILVDIMSGPGRPLFTLALGVENWNFLPPTATILDLGLNARVPPGGVPGATEDLGMVVSHIAALPDGSGVWFCSPGFYEYHNYYPADRWELIRDTDQGRITRIIEQACCLVDRRRAA